MALARTWRSSRAFVLLFAAWALGFANNRFGLWFTFERVIERAIPDATPQTLDAVADLMSASARMLGATYVVTLLFATFFVPVLALFRYIARSRARAGMPSPFAGAIERARTRTRAQQLAAAVPALAWLALLARPMHALDHPELFALPAFISALAHYALVRAGIRAAIAPIDADPVRTEVSPDEIHFAAVAVTPETRGAVIAMAALPFAFLAFFLSPLGRHVPAAGPLVAYIVVAVGGAVAFQRASRVAIGVDGVFVHGTSRTRFYAFSDLDEAREARGDLLLAHREKIVLRLQLHGDDATKREAILARLRASIARAKELRADAQSSLLAAASRGALARIADGAGDDYRAAAVSREELWSAIESPATEVATRAAAAKALARTAGDDERARLRVAAERCAEPAVRIALHAIADGQDVEAETERTPPKKRALTTG